MTRAFTLCWFDKVNCAALMPERTLLLTTLQVLAGLQHVSCFCDVSLPHWRLVDHVHTATAYVSPKPGRATRPVMERQTPIHTLVIS